MGSKSSTNVESRSSLFLKECTKIRANGESLVDQWNKEILLRGKTGAGDRNFEAHDESSTESDRGMPVLHNMLEMARNKKTDFDQALSMGEFFGIYFYYIRH